MGYSDYVGRIVRGSGDRPTRFHDERGNRIPLSGMYYILHAFLSTFLRLSFSYHPQVPWISYRARHYINRIMRPDWTVLEFGSGMSTIWLAHRCRILYSIEHNSVWYNTVQAIMLARGVSNLKYFLRSVDDTYQDLSSFPDNSFDFVLIDGLRRASCATNALLKVKPGGCVYLDNTDLGYQKTPNGDCQQAEQILLNFVKNKYGVVQYFTDFAPTSFVATQGMLVQL